MREWVSVCSAGMGVAGSLDVVCAHRVIARVHREIQQSMNIHISMHEYIVRDPSGERRLNDASSS